MLPNENSTSQRSWFWKWVVNNKTVSILSIVLLSLLIIFMLAQVGWFFAPIGELLSIIGFPIVLAGVLYYLISPLIDFCETRFKLNRSLVITVVFIVISGFLVWGIVVLIPAVQTQTISIIKNWPTYWSNITHQTNDFMSSSLFDTIKTSIEKINTDIVGTVSKKASSVIGSTVDSLGSVVGTVTTFIIGLVTAPFILFYLLKDGHDLPEYLSNFFPVRYRKSIIELLDEINLQVSQYIRGQLTVAFFVAILFVIGFSVVGLKFALTLGILAGFLNLIPYLGSFLAMIPALVIAAFVSPIMLIKVIVVFIVEQTIEARLISPLILGSSLAIHPVTILIVLLGSGRVFGLIGVIFGIPGYAILKVIVTRIFVWYKKDSGLYVESEETNKDNQKS
ncbi:AI-2E family transporter [Dellaglioa sp. P0083]|uniref:AI-2E family transporter n=1 Tax=Dellaglioa kimchii TaxID=3344667 RepID=UPI0038D3D3D9